MAAANRAPVSPPDLQGFNYGRGLGPLWAPRHAAGPARDRAGNRPLCDAPDAPWLRWSVLRPIVTSLRSLPQATTLAQGQARCGVRPTARGRRRAAAQGGDATVRQAVRAAWGRRGRP
jgi:hypothetical protein